MTRRTSPGRRHDESGVVAPARVMLVAIVLVAIAAATYVAGLGSGSSSSEADTATPASTRETPSASASSPSASSSPSVGASTPSAKASSRPSPSATARPKASSTPAPAVVRGDVSVSVFNNSSRPGLAARTSGKVKGAGWKVIGTDNWYGSIPQPTVYYPASLKAAAELLAKDAGIDRVKPAVSPMRNDRLTLIVTAGYRL